VAGQGQVTRGVGSPVLFGDDVLNMEREKGIVVLVQASVFAAVPCPLPDQFPREFVHYEPVASRARALAWRMATI
jgi:hypothetical protein